MQVLWAAWGKCKAWALLAGGVLLALAGVYATGRRDARAVAKVKALKGYKATRKRIDEADTLGDDPAVLRDFLRTRGQSDRHL